MLFHHDNWTNLGKSLVRANWQKYFIAGQNQVKNIKGFSKLISSLVFIVYLSFV